MRYFEIIIDEEFQPPMSIDTFHMADAYLHWADVKNDILEALFQLNWNSNLLELAFIDPEFDFGNAAFVFIEDMIDENTAVRGM